MKKSLALLAIFGLIFLGCAGIGSKIDFGPSIVTENKKLPDGYIDNMNIKGYSVSYKKEVVASEHLKATVNEKFAEGISAINSKKPGINVNLSIEIDSIKIANKAATMLVGGFAGDNRMCGSVIMSDSELNNIIGHYTIEVDLNYGGFSAGVDLEYRTAEKFAIQAMKLLVRRDVIKYQ